MSTTWVTEKKRVGIWTCIVNVWLLSNKLIFLRFSLVFVLENTLSLTFLTYRHEFSSILLNFYAYNKKLQQIFCLFLYTLDLLLEELQIFYYILILQQLSCPNLSPSSSTFVANIWIKIENWNKILEYVGDNENDEQTICLIC